jgi:mannose-1-phosphate guanylyltransferase
MEKMLLSEKRPWGSFFVIENGNGFKIKRIEVDPKQSLSLQSHQYRSEHWVVVSGKAKVINGTEELILDRGESTFIPIGAKHRLTNISQNEMLVIIEVQIGSYLGEDDIKRYEDIYNRLDNYEKL